MLTFNRKLDQSQASVERMEQQVGNLDVRLQDTDNCATNARAMLELKADRETVSALGKRVNSVAAHMNAVEQMAKEMEGKYKNSEAEIATFKQGASTVA